MSKFDLCLKKKFINEGKSMNKLPYIIDKLNEFYHERFLTISDREVQIKILSESLL